MSSKPPNVGTYRYVLQYQRFIVERDSHPIDLIGYEESRESLSLALPGEPRRHTVFCSKPSTRERGLRTGWVDVSAEWFEYLQSLRPRVSTPSQRKIVETLTDDWMTKAEIVSATGIADSEWRTSIKMLNQRGIATVNAGTSTRDYRYKRGPRFHEAVICDG